MSARLCWLDSERAQRWFLIGLGLLFVSVSVQYTIKVLTPRDDGLTRSAFLRWAPQIQALEDGENINRLYQYPNPPIMALILWPLTELPPVVGALSWFYLKVGMTLLAFHWVFRLVERPTFAFPPWAKVLTIALSLRPILSDLSHGNVNILILFLIVATLYAFHRGYDVLAGILLALAIACKLTPALLVGYFLWKGAWRTLFGTLLGLALFLVILPSSLLGFTYNWQLLTSWVQVMVLPYLVDNVITSEHHNQSLPGLLTRLLSHAPSFSDYLDDQYVPLAYHNIMALSTSTVRRLVQGAMLLFGLLVIGTCHAPIRRTGEATATTRQNGRLAAEYALIVLGMLIFSERTWKHHCVTFVLPFAVLCYELSFPGRSRAYRLGLSSILALATLSIMSTSTGLLGDAAKLAQVYGGFTWAFGLLVLGLMVVLWQPAPSEPTGAGQGSVLDGLVRRLAAGWHARSLRRA